MKWISRAAIGGLLWLAFSTVAFGDTLYLTPTFTIDEAGVSWATWRRIHRTS